MPDTNFNLDYLNSVLDVVIHAYQSRDNLFSHIQDELKQQGIELAIEKVEESLGDMIILIYLDPYNPDSRVILATLIE